MIVDYWWVNLYPKNEYQTEIDRKVIKFALLAHKSRVFNEGEELEIHSQWAAQYRWTKAEIV